ncbi:hypothetical protein VNO80_09744 [Phaseolus coccineus]|uniref:Uncharacterized protein n=1 Tax=Phaseolus coccineus TaxID=3886 RepID=A0AAN9N7E1_PHACN
MYHSCTPNALFAHFLFQGFLYDAIRIGNCSFLIVGSLRPFSQGTRSYFSSSAKGFCPRGCFVKVSGLPMVFIVGNRWSSKGPRCGQLRFEGPFLLKCDVNINSALAGYCVINGMKWKI